LEGLGYVKNSVKKAEKQEAQLSNKRFKGSISFRKLLKYF